MEIKEAETAKNQWETGFEEQSDASSKPRQAKAKNQKKYGDIVRKYRKKAKVSQQELCRKLGVSSAYMSQIESNRMKPAVDMVIPLCEFLNIPLNEFFSLKKAGEDLAPNEVDLLRAFRKASPTVRKAVLTILTAPAQKDDVVQYPTGGIPESLKFQEEGTPPKRGRGRPRKTPLVPPDEQKPKRGRGRPRKMPLEPQDEQKPKRGRGRPRKNEESGAENKA